MANQQRQADVLVYQDTHQETDPRHDKESSQPASEQLIHELRRLLAELLGTFALTIVAAGGVVIGALFQRDVNTAALFVASGLTVMAMIYALGSTSGAHINPAITLAFALRQDFAWKRVPGYWAAQLLGSILAALLLRLLFGTVEHLGAPLPHQSVAITFVMEVLLTFLLVTVILGIATKGELVGNNVAIAVGGTVALCGLFAGPVSGASMNPARALGPYLISGQVENAWIYVIAPLVGALLAAGMAWLLRGKTNPEAEKAATGEEHDPNQNPRGQQE